MRQPRIKPPSTVPKSKWPPNYTKVFQWRQQQLLDLRADPVKLFGAKEYYKTRPIEFINHWVDTFDPRNAGKEGKLTRMPLIMFPRQEELVEFIYGLLDSDENGLTEKCRDMGATWICCAISVHLWLFFPGVSVGWGSRKEDYVDKRGVMDSIFEKIRAIINNLPREFWPGGFRYDQHMPHMRIINPENGSAITGEAGDNIGRGGRTRIYFKDESAHYERPELIEAALGDNTRVQFDISSVNGLANVFYRKRQNGVEWDGEEIERGKTNVFVMEWRDHPEKTQEWYNQRRQRAEEDGMLHLFAQEVDRDYAASLEGTVILRKWVQAAIDADKVLDFEITGPRIAGDGRKRRTDL